MKAERSKNLGLAIDITPYLYTAEQLTAEFGMRASRERGVSFCVLDNDAEHIEEESD